uniref:Uncharacterized protein n=1 Tax=Meloidogyne incognita TaxID=6306 RepID=A0A914M4R6_MELIC
MGADNRKAELNRNSDFWFPNFEPFLISDSSDFRHPRYFRFPTAGNDHVHASFIPKFGIACSLVPNALLRGNPVDEFKAAEGPYPCGDGTVERRGHGWEEDDHYDDFTSDPVSWYGHEKFGITDNSIKRKGWGTE